MSKCREAFDKWVFDNQETASDREREVWQAAWNTRGKVDAEAIQEVRRNGDGQSTYWYSGIDACAEAIEKENEK